MPSPPYTVSGTIYDIDGSTKLLAAQVTAYNVTTKEKTSVTSDVSGNFILSLSNLASGYTLGDRIVLSVQYGGGSSSAVRSLSKRRTTADGDNGVWEVGNLVLHEGGEAWGTCYIAFAHHSNSSSGGLYVDFYDRENDVRVFRIECPAGDSESIFPSWPGIKMDGGYIRIFESETAGESKVLTHWR